MKRLLAAALALCLVCPVKARTPKYVALTFDDGPSGRFTQRLLDGLSEREVKATFLLCGYRMAQYPELTARIAAEGHEIGLHGYSHKCMANLSAEEMRRELTNTRALAPTDCPIAFLRPPGGVMNQTVTDAAREAGLAILSWSVDPRDWATHNAASVEQAVLKEVRDGDVILLHDMSDSSVEAALYLVDALQTQGYVFVTASQLAAQRGTTPQPGTVYHRFLPEPLCRGGS